MSYMSGNNRVLVSISSMVLIESINLESINFEINYQIYLCKSK